jgi:hypothetical protein
VPCNASITAPSRVSSVKRPAATSCISVAAVAKGLVNEARSKTLSSRARP